MSTTMNTTPDLLNHPATHEADAEAVMDQVLSGIPLDPVVAARVRKRSALATEALRRKFGTVDVAVDLLRESRDEE